MLWSFGRIKRRISNRYQKISHEIRSMRPFVTMETMRRHATLKYHQPDISGLERENAANVKAEAERALSEHISVNMNHLFTITGNALSSWARMEQKLVMIACCLLRTNKVEKAGVVMYSIINFSVWLSLI